MARRIGLFVFVLAMVFACNVFADDGQAVSNPFEIRFDVNELSRTQKVAKELSHEIDLWHDAVLKRNGKRMRKHERRMFSIIDSDIEARQRVVNRYEREASKSVVKAANGRVLPAGKYAVRDDLKDLRKARQLLKAKEILYDTIKRTEAFSNRYRLLGDYLEVVKREGRLNKVELAEDTRQPKKNAFE